MIVNYLKGEYIESGIKVYLDQEVTAEWISKFRSARVTNTSFDSSGDFLKLDLNKTEFLGDSLIQRFNLEDAKKLQPEFIKRVKLAIAIANLETEADEKNRIYKQEQAEKEQKKLKEQLEELNKNKF